ncbi:hypothetical protein ACJMK2_025449 [Sinanodonta woodiana]|uniref:Uncharacterized protein n=1 Tax=Sinanodonta woodiana TaxID=1069815 RepID=A0ABD3XGM1_SINWO
MWQTTNTLQSSGSVYHGVCDKLQIPCSLQGQYTMVYVANSKYPAVFRVSIPWCMWQTVNTLQSSGSVYHGVCGKQQIPCSLHGQYTMVYVSNCKYPAVFRVSIPWCMWQTANALQSSGQYTIVYVANSKCPAAFRVSIPWCMWQTANALQPSGSVYHGVCGKLQMPCSLQGQYTIVYVANYM